MELNEDEGPYSNLYCYIALAFRHQAVYVQALRELN